MLVQDILACPRYTSRTYLATLSPKEACPMRRTCVPRFSDLSEAAPQLTQVPTPTSIGAAHAWTSYPAIVRWPRQAECVFYTKFRLEHNQQGWQPELCLLASKRLSDASSTPYSRGFTSHEHTRDTTPRTLKRFAGSRWLRGSESNTCLNPYPSRCTRS